MYIGVDIKDFFLSELKYTDTLGYVNKISLDRMKNSDVRVGPVLIIVGWC